MRERLEMYRKSGRGPIWSFLNEFDEIFGWPFGPYLTHDSEPIARKENSFKPLMEITELKNAYVLVADLTGVKREDLKVDLVGRKLTISGNRGPSHQFQWAYGSFTRTFVLPENVNLEKIDASFSDGILRIRMPKLASDQRRSIPIDLDKLELTRGRFSAAGKSQFSQEHTL